MKSTNLLRILLTFLLLVSLTKSENPQYNDLNITLIVVGRSESGISTTVKEIVGPSKTIQTPTEPPSPILEILIPIPGYDSSFFKIVDVEGLVDGKTKENDNLTIESLKSYLTDPQGLNGTEPNFFLIISNFDDNLLQRPNSIFTKTITHVFDLQQSLYNKTTSTTLFLLTKYMSSTKATQRQPRSKIKEFSDIIRNQTSFTDPINILLGENKWQENELELDNGFAILPNGDKYPENIYNRLIAMATNLNATNTARGLRICRDIRKTIVHSKYYTRQIKQLIEPDVITTSENVIISTTPQYVGNLGQTTAIPISSKNYSEIQANIDKTVVVSRSDDYFPIVEKDNLSNTLGQSYHILKELVLSSSPFPIRDIMASKKYKEIQPCVVGRYKTFIDTSDYLKDRWANSFNLIALPLNPSRFFTGKVMEGNNILGKTPNNGMECVQVRMIYTELTDPQKLHIDSRFSDELNSLPSFHYSNLPDCHGKQKWLKFFEKYGTHFISAFYSGYTFDRNVMPDKKPGYSSPNQPTCVPCYNGKGDPPTPTRGLFQTDISDSWGLSTPVKPKLKKCEEAAVIKVGGDQRLSRPVKFFDRIKSSYTFISYSDYFARKNLTLSQSIDEAMYQLIDYNLTC